LSYKICPIFPAFGSEYTGYEKQFIIDYSKDAKKYFLAASALLEIDFEFVNMTNESVAKDELLSQYITYIYSTIISKILKRGVSITPCCAGYSMGLYAALYHSEAVEFSDGLLLIKKAFELISENLKNEDFSMSGIVGLELKDISNIIKKHSKKVSVININSKNSFAVSGAKNEIKRVMDAARLEGALGVKELPISTPYHTPYISSRIKESFKNYAKSLNIKKPVYQIISNIDQRSIISKDDVIKELADNLTKRQSWHKTMLKLMRLKNKSFFECGPSKSLFKISKFIEGEHKVYTLKDLSEMLF
jgi:[acyl-carrier-protein] S-malonyltransferase